MTQNSPRDEFGNLLPVPDTETFAAWDGEDLTRRIVARTMVAPGVAVSSLCRGADDLGRVEMVDGEPRLFETMIVGGECDGQLWPPATSTEAQRDHTEAVLIARAALAQRAR